MALSRNWKSGERFLRWIDSQHCAYASHQAAVQWGMQPIEEHQMSDEMDGRERQRERDRERRRWTENEWKEEECKIFMSINEWNGDRWNRLKLTLMVIYHFENAKKKTDSTAMFFFIQCEAWVRRIQLKFQCAHIDARVEMMASHFTVDAARDCPVQSSNPTKFASANALWLSAHVIDWCECVCVWKKFRCFRIRFFLFQFSHSNRRHHHHHRHCYIKRKVNWKSCLGARKKRPTQGENTWSTRLTVYGSH